MTDQYIPVVDVSNAQGIIDFGVIARAGIPGVIIRACNALKRDIRFDRNWRAARDAGLDVAVYGFSNPKATAGPNEQGAFLAELAHEASAAWVMHDEEKYSLEAGPNPVLKGASAASWTAAKIRRCQIDAAAAQVIYTSDTYWNPTFTPGVFDRALGRFTDAWRADLDYLAQFDLILARYVGQRRGPPVFDPLPRDVAPADWAAAVAATGKTAAMPKGFDPVRKIAHQFSAGGNGQGATYGCASTDLDLNIFLTAAYQRLYHPALPTPIGDDMPSLVANLEPRQMPWGLSSPGSEFFVVDVYKRNIGGEELSTLYAGFIVKQLSNAALDAIPDAFPVSSIAMPPVVVPPLTGHIVADLGAGGHITGSVG